MHSGDFTMGGSEQEAVDFLDWLCDLQHPHKILIAGNHDDCLFGAEISGLDRNVHYLCNSGVTIGGVRFYGVPMFTADCLTDRQERNYAAIPEDTDVLVTHCPPYGILDFDDGINYGDGTLLARVAAVNPRLHLFGHIHAAYGQQTLGATTFSNAAAMSAEYDSFRPPRLIEF